MLMREKESRNAMLFNSNFAFIAKRLRKLKKVCLSEDSVDAESARVDTTEDYWKRI
jgi:hypothetical protein